MTTMNTDNERIDRITDDLHDCIINIKRELKVTRVKPDTVYLADAGALCNIGATANQVHQILTRQKNLDAMNNTDDLLAKYMPYLTIMAVCAAAVLIAVLVVDYVK